MAMSQIPDDQITVRKTWGSQKINISETVGQIGSKLLQHLPEGVYYAVKY